MRYVWNPEFDIFCLRDRVDFVAINHEVSLEGSMVAKATRQLIEMFYREEGGFALADTLQALVSFDQQDVDHLLWTLVQEGLLKDRESITAQTQVSLPRQPLSYLLRQFPDLFSDGPCNQIGFRFGGLYLLASSSRQMSALSFAGQIIEWAFSGKWLDRARPLLWQTGEQAVFGVEFLPPHVSQWLQCTLDTLLTTQNTDCLYEIDLRTLQIKHENLEQPSLSVGALAPVIQQEDVTNCERQTGFTPSCTIVLSRYRQPGIWDGARQYIACGAHSNPWVARRISVAEAIERSVAATWKASDLSYGKLEDDARRVDPRCLIELDNEQQETGGLHPFDPEQPYYWCDAIDLVGGKKAQIIADLCYLHFDPPEYQHRFAWGNSSGMAAGRTLAEAQQSALFELIERDAFMVTWIAKRSAPHISDFRIPFGIRESSLQLRSIGYETALIDITVRGVPTVLGVAYRDEWPALILGLATRNTLLKAIRAAWKEVEVGVYCRLLDPMMESNDKPLLQIEEVHAADEHGKFYNHPAHLKHASFLWGSTENSERPLEESFFAEDLTNSGDIVSICRQMAIDQLYLMNYGSVCGLPVVRLLAPQLVPLTFGHNLLPRQQVARSGFLDSCAGVLPDAFPVHPID